RRRPGAASGLVADRPLLARARGPPGARRRRALGRRRAPRPGLHRRRLSHDREGAAASDGGARRRACGSEPGRGGADGLRAARDKLDGRGGIMKFETAIVGGQVVFPGETTVPASIGIRDGRIACIQVGGDLDADHVIDASGAYVTPGVVESHSHLCIGNGYEDLTTETVAALRGGVTSILFFLRHPAPYDETFQRTVAEGERRSPIDFGFHVVLLTDEHQASVPRYLREY